MKIAAALAVVGAALLAAPQTWDWGDETEWPEFEETKAICRSVRDHAPPSSDQPRTNAARSLRGCDSEALYYGIGRPADAERARQCAFLEMAAGDERVFGGRAMLMTIYANGVGVERDLDLAIHLACGIEGAPAEVDGRVRRLAERRETGWTGRDFHLCDDVTSGLMMGHCAGHEARIAGARREAALATLVSDWSPRERIGLEPLRRAHEAYVSAHGAGEVDLSGTMRGALQIGEEESLRAEFLDMLGRLDAGRAPVHFRGAFQTADAELNRLYRERIRSESGDCAGCVTRAGITSAQRAWLAYRDAFLRFAAVRFPRVSRDSLATWLTRQRIERLRGED